MSSVAGVTRDRSPLACSSPARVIAVASVAQATAVGHLPIEGSAHGLLPGPRQARICALTGTRFLCCGRSSMAADNAGAGRSRQDERVTPRGAPLRATVVFLAIALAGTVVAGWLYQDRLRLLEQGVSVLSLQAGSHLAAWIDARIALVEVLVDRSPRGSEVDAEAFRLDAQALLARTPGLLALNWVDTDGVIRVVVPDAGNEAALGRNLFDHPEPDVARAIGEARQQRVITRTRNIELLQGGNGFGIYWPVQTDDGVLLGLVNAVIRARELVETSRLATDLGAGYWFALRDADGAVAWSNTQEAPEDWRLAAEQRVPVPGIDWVLSIAPNPPALAAAVALPQLVMLVIASYLLAAWAAFVVWRRSVEQERLFGSERSLRGLLDLLPHPIYVKDQAGRFTFVNRALAQACGQPAAAMLGAGWELLPGNANERQQAQEADLAALSGGVGAGDSMQTTELPLAETPLTPVRGRRRLLQMARLLFRDPVTDAPALLGVGVDVTDRHEAEGLRERIASALDQAGDAIALLDVRGRVEFANAAFIEMMGFRGQDVRGMGIDAFAVAGSDDDALIDEIAASLAKGEVWKRRYTSTWADGDRVRDASVAPFRDATGRLSGYISVLRDMTREQQLEEELRQAQRLEAVGRLSGGIAHDFNNLLTVILGYTEALRSEPGDVAPEEAAEEIHQAALRAAELTRQLLTFSRRGQTLSAATELNVVVSELVPMLDRLIGEHITLQQALDPQVGWVGADKSEIEQVIVNLCVNARDAMASGGCIRITTGVRSTGSAPPGLRPRLPTGTYAVLEVTDDGSGMAPEIQERVFEPFFTTKDVGEGTGLGLSTVYGIAEQRGGAVHVRSAPAEGTTVTVWLPVIEALPAEAAVVESKPQAAAVSSATLLVVEDEPGIRNLMKMTLEQAGYRVITAADGSEALELARAERDIDLLITDVVMPRMGGIELRDRLLEIRPSLRVLFVSGYAPDDARTGSLDEDDILLEKPFRPQALRAEVAACLQ
ncbi:MAG: response regulator [Gammaproteobacteria bacterium]|nr:MAG: response regulator [Gammaproteobacteria bacterium]